LTSNTTYKLQVDGSFAATTKSFLIKHPSKPEMFLQHGVLEGPEHGVYVRGRTTERSIILPDYWANLVDESTITVQLTPIGKSQNLIVNYTSIRGIIIENTSGDSVDCYYFIQAERKDIPKLQVEI